MIAKYHNITGIGLEIIRKVTYNEKNNDFDTLLQ